MVLQLQVIAPSWDGQPTAFSDPAHETAVTAEVPFPEVAVESSCREI